jgi:hypothetical protein
MSATSISGAFVYRPPVGKPWTESYVFGKFDIALTIFEDGTPLLDGDVSNIFSGQLAVVLSDPDEPNANRLINVSYAHGSIGTGSVRIQGALADVPPEGWMPAAIIVTVNCKDQGGNWILSSAIITAALPAVANSGMVAVSITTTSLPNGKIRQPYLHGTLAASGGSGSYTWSISAGALPNGLQLAPATGVISGVATRIGVASFTAQVTDSLGGIATKALSIKVTR